ncbi:MAG TPA: TetR/AcrR family transcriptional regulator [Solirubrobacterales bacterium]|nr:TetR/AcrR family transcriptional regulator [Solirubrobacterales bacterium]
MSIDTTTNPLAVGKTPPSMDPAVPRGRLLIAMAESIAEKGFGDTVVADVVRLARVSRRTFYEHFSDREDCFLALCDATTSWIVDLIDEAVDPEDAWHDQTARAIDVYIGVFTSQPSLTRSFLFEIYSTGERGVRQHRKVQRRFAEQLFTLAANVRKRHPELNPVSFHTASAIIAGVGELAMLAIEDGTADGVTKLRSVAIELVGDVLTAPRKT